MAEREKRAVLHGTWRYDASVDAHVLIYRLNYDPYASTYGVYEDLRRARCFDESGHAYQAVFFTAGGDIAFSERLCFPTIEEAREDAESVTPADIVWRPLA